MTTFKDIFKKSFLEGFGSTEITLKYVLAVMLLTAFLSMYIFFLYRIITKKTFYSKSFNLSLVGVAMITAAVIVTIQSNVVMSLGMVGALSIVRFRTAVKDPMDLMFMFWAISTGIICGAGFAEYAFVLAIILTLAVVFLDRIPIARPPMVLVVNSSDLDAEDAVMDVVKRYSSSCSVKSRSMAAQSFDMTVELRTSQGSELVRELLKNENIRSASLLSHDGEVTF